MRYLFYFVFILLVGCPGKDSSKHDFMHAKMNFNDAHSGVWLQVKNGLPDFYQGSERRKPILEAFLCLDHLNQTKEQEQDRETDKCIALKGAINSGDTGYFEIPLAELDRLYPKSNGGNFVVKFQRQGDLSPSYCRDGVGRVVISPNYRAQKQHFSFTLTQSNTLTFSCLASITADAQEVPVPDHVRNATQGLWMAIKNALPGVSKGGRIVQPLLDAYLCVGRKTEGHEDEKCIQLKNNIPNGETAYVMVDPGELQRLYPFAEGGKFELRFASDQQRVRSVYWHCTPLSAGEVVLLPDYTRNKATFSVAVTQSNRLSFSCLRETPHF